MAPYPILFLLHPCIRTTGVENANSSCLFGNQEKTAEQIFAKCGLTTDFENPLKLCWFLHMGAKLAVGTQWRHWENQSVGALIKGGEWDFVFTTKTNDPLLENPSHVRQLALLSQVPTMNIGANFMSQPSGKSVTPLSLLRKNSAL